jgi:hypothetical protein
LKKFLPVLLLPAALAAYWLWPDPAPPQAPRPSELPLLTIPSDIPGARPAAAPPALAPATPLINALERAGDLRAAYEQYQGIPDAAGRNAAYRAWSACFPTFVAPQGQTITLEGVVRAIAPEDPDNLRRIDAYRALMGRCKNFSDLPRERILSETERQHSAVSGGAALAPGQLAAKLLNDGDTGAALAMARAVVAARDPAAIDSLREFINLYLVQQVDGQNTPLDVRPDLRSLAFSIAACSMGLECGPDSLTALQQCANSGACSGGVVERYLASVPEAADRERLLRESRQVADAIAAGDYRALGL